MGEGVGGLEAPNLVWLTQRKIRVNNFKLKKPRGEKCRKQSRQLGSGESQKEEKKGNRWPSVNRAETAGRNQFHFRRLHHLFPSDIKGPIKVPVKPDVKGCRRGPVKHQAPPPTMTTTEVLPPSPPPAS